MRLSTLAAAVALLAGTGIAQAATVASQFFTGFQQLSDNSAEYQFTDPNDNGLLDAGEKLRGIFTIETLEQGATTRNLGGSSGNNELTGIFEVVVSSVVRETLGVAGSYFYTFAPSPTFEAVYGSGAMVAMFEGAGATLDYSRIGCTIAGCEATATNGTHFLTMGFAGAQNFWVADASTNNIASIGAIPAPGNGGTFNVGLDILEQGPAAAGLNFGTVDCGKWETVDISAGLQLPPGSIYAQTITSINQVSACGSGSLLGTGGVNTPFQSFDNVDFTMNVVPEPGTLALVGAVLAGLGFGSGVRRRKV